MDNKTYIDIQENVIKTVLNLSSTKGWQKISMADIAYELDLSKSELQSYFYDKDDILYALSKFIDRKIVAIVDVDEGESEKDRLFEVLMEKFDVLNEYRSAMISIISSMKCEPVSAVILFPHIGKSMALMYGLAKVDISGLRGAVKIAGLTGIYLNCLRVWIDDETSDMAKTMACLDKSLGRVEGFL